METYLKQKKTLDFITKLKSENNVELTELQKLLLTPVVLDNKKNAELKDIYSKSVIKEGKHYVPQPFRYSYITYNKNKLFICVPYIHLKLWEDFLLANYQIVANFDKWEINKYEQVIIDKYLKFFYKPLGKGANDVIKTLVKEDTMCVGWKVPELITQRQI